MYFSSLLNTIHVVLLNNKFVILFSLMTTTTTFILLTKARNLFSLDYFNPSSASSASSGPSSAAQEEGNSATSLSSSSSSSSSSTTTSKTTTATSASTTHLNTSIPAIKVEQENIDTRSIIESKEAIKEYWERRMMADQGLLLEEPLLKEPAASRRCSESSSKSDSSSPHEDLQIETKVSNARKLNSPGPVKAELRNFGPVNGNAGKLGSDGESEASPECSLSPVEVDSLEEGGSEGRRSPEGSHEEVLLLHSLHELSRNCREKESQSPTMLVCKDGSHEAEEKENEREKETERVVDDDDNEEQSGDHDGDEPEGVVKEPFEEVQDTVITCCKPSADESLVQIDEAENAENGFDLKERDDLSTVMEEEQEPDSLEEFIKHENECMKDERGSPNDLTKLKEPAITQEAGEIKMDSASETNDSHLVCEEQPKTREADEGQTDGPLVAVAVPAARDQQVFAAKRNVQLHADTIDRVDDVGETPTEPLLQSEREPDLPIEEEEVVHEPKVELPVQVGNLLDLEPEVMRQTEKENVYEEIPLLTRSDIQVLDESNEVKSPVELDCQVPEEVAEEQIERPLLEPNSNGVEEEGSSKGEDASSSISTNTTTTTVSSLDVKRESEDGKESLKPQIVGQTYQSPSEATTPATGGSDADAGGTGSLVKDGQVRLEDSSGSAEKGVNLKRTETKIAEEIREQREREEELKKMREEIKQRASAVSENILQKSFSLAPSSPPQSASQLSNGRVSPAPSDLSSGSSFVSVDSLENCAMKSPEKIKVKPYLDNDYNNVTYKVLNESPIEREIRLAKEREEALKLEKSIMMNNANGGNEPKETSGSSRQQKLQKSVVSSISSSKVPSLKPVFSGASSASNIQKVLATTRIQQEIEEQTQREIELREKGSIKTISQERTDVKVTKLGEIERVTSNKQPNPASPVATPESEPTEAAPFSSLSHSVNNGLNGNVPKRKSSLPQVFGVGNVKNISMHKFISSKGKSANVANSFSPFSTSNGESDYPLRPPQILKGEKGIRRQVPAESKIQEELKEMKAREEELKWQRARMMGKSQPNLATLINEENETGRVENSTPKEITNGNGFMKRTISIPNLIENNDQKPQVCHLGSGKKRNPLIEQWELKIQKVVNVSN